MVDRQLSSTVALRRSSRLRWSSAAGLLLALAVLSVVAVVSVCVGSKPIALGTVLQELLGTTGSDDGTVIRELRVPRTLLGLAVGAALGAAGALMQALTRNPLADPGILGVNAGASAAVVAAISLLGMHDPSRYLWFALAGAAGASVLVYALGARGRAAATPVRLALAGTAVSAVLGAFVSAVVLTDQTALDDFRFWSVGALTGQPPRQWLQVLPPLAVGALLTLGLARSLNAIALGDEAGRAIGAHPGRARLVGFVAVTLLCGGATAAAGPIGFVGLTVPHVARMITGPDHRWLLPYSMVLGAILLVGADVVGRVVARPGELQAGVVTAFVGAPVFVWLVRRHRTVTL